MVKNLLEIFLLDNKYRKMRVPADVGLKVQVSDTTKFNRITRARIKIKKSGATSISFQTTTKIDCVVLFYNSVECTFLYAP